MSSALTNANVRAADAARALRDPVEYSRARQARESAAVMRMIVVEGL